MRSADPTPDLKSSLDAMIDPAAIVALLSSPTTLDRASAGVEKASGDREVTFSICTCDDLMSLPGVIVEFATARYPVTPEVWEFVEIE